MAAGAYIPLDGLAMGKGVLRFALSARLGRDKEYFRYILRVYM